MSIATSTEDRKVTLQLTGDLDLHTSQDLLDEVEHHLEQGIQGLELNLVANQKLDSFGVASLIETYRLADQQGIQLKIRGLSEDVIDLLQMIDVEKVAASLETQPPTNPSFFERTGGRSLRFRQTSKDFLVLASNALYFGFIGPFRGQGFKFWSLVGQIARAGVNALPVIILLSFLVGLIMAMQSDHQLRKFGAQHFVPQLMAVTIIRELGPFLTGVIVAARTGSSIAAELGTMVVTEEVDALKTIGLNPYVFIVVPRLLSLLLVVPCLTIVFDISGLGGGYCVAYATGESSFSEYYRKTVEALDLLDLMAGLTKAFFFGLGISLISCFMGLRITQGAEGVGRATTGSVVLSIFVLVGIDLFFTGLFFMS